MAMAAIVTGVSVLAILLTSIRLVAHGKDLFAAFGVPVLLFGACVWFSLPVVVGGPAALRSQCKNNLRIIGLGLHQALDETGNFPPAVSSLPTPRSWRVDLLPWIDHAPLRQQYDDSSAWDSSRNEPFARMQISSYICPANFNPKDQQGRYYTAYAAVAGPGTILGQEPAKQPRDVKDGLSNTALIIEACGREIIWTEPRDIDVQRDPGGLNLSGASKTNSPGWGSSYHPGGCHVVMGDGVVRFIFENIDPTLLTKLVTADGGESITDEEF